MIISVTTTTPLQISKELNNSIATTGDPNKTWATAVLQGLIVIISSLCKTLLSGKIGSKDLSISKMCIFIMILSSIKKCLQCLLLLTNSPMAE